MALLNTAYPLWAQLSYRQNSADGTSYYADWDSLHSTSSLWKTANLVFNYGSLTFWAVALVTQILSFVGILADINMLIWSYGIFQGLGYLTLAYVVMNFLAIRKPYAADNNSASDDESAVFEDIWNETMTVIGAQAFSFAILYTNYPSWEKSQKMASEPADEAPEEEEVAPEEEGEATE